MLRVSPPWRTSLLFRHDKLCHLSEVYDRIIVWQVAAWGCSAGNNMVAGDPPGFRMQAGRPRHAA